MGRRGLRGGLGPPHHHLPIKSSKWGDSMAQWVVQEGGAASTSLWVASVWLEKALGALSHTLSHHWGFLGHVPPTACVCVCVSDPLSFPGLCPFPACKH